MDPNFNQQPSPFLSEDDVYRSKLDNEFRRVDEASKALDKNEQEMADKLRKIKTETLKKVYSLMEEMGVNPADVSAVSEFIQKLEEQDPDLVSLLEMIFNELDPDKVEPEMPLMPEGEEPGLMEQGMFQDQGIEMPEGGAIQQ